MAYAAACDFDPSTNRPIQAFINLCPVVYAAAKHDLVVESLVHELVHALVSWLAWCSQGGCDTPVTCSVEALERMMPGCTGAGACTGEQPTCLVRQAGLA